MQVLNILISFFALIIAGLALWRTWSLSKAQAELINKQLLAQLKAKIKVDLVQGSNSDRIILTNEGGAAASKLHFSLIIPEGGATPLCGDYEKTFPLKILHPGDSISVLAALSKETGVQFEYLMKWENSDKTQGVREGVVSLNG
jgi:hypothetical protein